MPGPHTTAPTRSSEAPINNRWTAPLATLWRAPHLLLLLAMLFWSGNFVIGRAVHELVPPVALAFWRWLVAAVLVLVLGWRHLAADLPALRAAWRNVVVLAATGVAAFNTFVYIGLQWTAAINALLLQSVMPLLILVAALVLFGERTSRRQAAGVLVSLGGVAVIVARGSPRVLAELSFNAGDGWVLLAVASYALYSVLLRRRPAVHPLSFLAATFVLGTALLLPVHVAEHLLVEPLRPGAAVLAAIAYVAVFPSVLAYLCFNRGVDLLGAARAGQFLHLMPVFGSVLAWAFLGEPVRAFHVGGALLIGAGLLVARRGVSAVSSPRAR